MASYYPPTNFFQNINFNNDFYAIPNNNQGISLAYANTHYLFSTGVATSTAITTFFSGSVGIGTIGGTAGTINALVVNAINSIQINGNDISNIYVSSNVILNYLLPYDKITDRNTAITTASNTLQGNINATNTNISTNYYNKTTIDNSLGLKQNNLTFSTPLNNTNNTVSIDLSLYDKITDRNTAITTSSNTLQGNINTTNNNLSTNYYNKTTLDTSLGLKQNNLTFTSPLNSNANTISIDLSLYDKIVDRQTAINAVNVDIGNCLKKVNVDAGNIGLFQAVGGAYLNIVFNSTHFKDVSILATNRQFNLNDVYANLPTTKNNVINWTSPLSYNSSTDTASIDLSLYDKIVDRNTAITSTSNILQGKINAKQDTLTAATNLVGNGAALTNLTYANITGTPTMANYVLKAGDTMTGALSATSLSVGSALINYWMFNNMGGTHGDLTDFNNITDFGYKFIQGSTNSPNTGASQYYSWFIGLGNNYNATTYGAQFGLPRNITNPTLSVRYKEGNNWGSWSGITAGKAETLTSGDKTVSGNLTVNNITLASNGKINSSDDYHYIQISQPTDTLTIQEYGTISFTIGPTKTQKAYINSSGLTATAFFGDGAGLTNLPLSSYSTTSINDTKYLKLDGTNSMALNSSIALTGTGKFSGDGSLLTNLNYNSFTNPPDLTLYNGWTKSGNDIYNTLQSGKVGIGLTNPTGKLEFNYNYPSGTFTNFYLKFGHETKYAFNSIFCNYYYRFYTSYTGTNEIAHFGYVDSYDTPTLRTSVLKITRDELNMNGDLYLNKKTLSSSRGVYLTAKSNSISNLISSKPPFAAYFAEDFSGNTIPNYIKNGRDATTTGTITKITDSTGNNFTVPITYITGTTASTITFATGSIPSTFTILSLTRYNGGTRQRILTSKTTGDWCHGHKSSLRGYVRYGVDRSRVAYANFLDNWVCVIGKNVGSSDGSILVDGVIDSLNSNGSGNYTLGINNGVYPAEYSDFGFNCVMIWDTILTDAEMVLLNDMINTYKGDGESLKQYFNDDCSMENREYTTNSSRELLLFKSNNINSSSGTDRIRLKATNILFDTFSTTTTDKTVESTKMIIASSGNVGIANTSPKLTLDIGSTNANHNIGRAILTAGNLHNADKLDFLSIGRWDGSSTADWQFSGIKYGVTTAADAGETYNNHSCMTFYTWGNNISNSREVMRLTSRGRLGIGTLLPTELLDVNGNIKCSGNLGIGITNYSANTKLTIKGASSTYLQPLVRIEQTAGWDGNYALQVVGYSDFGGIRINGLDTGNTIYTTGANDMGLTTNAGAMKFAVNGAERMRINTTGNVGIGTATPNTNLEIYNTSPAISIKGSSEADTATLYLATPYTTASAYKCAIIAKGTSGWSRSYLHFCLNNVADNTYPAQNAGLNNIRMTIKPDGNINFYPEPFYINNTNGANYSVNLNVACNTTYTPATAAFLTATVADGWNSLDTIITLACSSRANSGYYNESRMILDGSYNTNSGRGTRGSYIYWQSIDGAGNWMTNAELYTNTSPILNAVFNVNGLVKSYGVTLSSSKEIKTNLRDIYDPLDLIEKFQGKHYFNLKTNQKDFGLVAEDVEQICPCLTSRTEDTGVGIGIKYMNLTAVLVEGIKQLNGKVKTLENIIQQQSLIIQNIQAQI